MVFVPSAEIASLTALAEPLPTATSTMTAATPMRMPSMVSAERRMFAVRPCQAVIRVSRQVMPGPHPDLVTDDLAVADVDDAAGVIGDGVFVRDQDDGSTRLVKRVEHRHDVGTGRRIEVAGRLVCEEQRRVH